MLHASGPDHLAEESSLPPLNTPTTRWTGCPWVEAAFTGPAPRTSPVFLSIGYCSCHWCHVMEQRGLRGRDRAA